MYSRKRYSDDADRHFDNGYGTVFEDEDLGVYNLPPRYDGSRFRRRSREESCRRCEEYEAPAITQCPSDTSETEACSLEETSAKPCKSDSEGVLRFLEGMGGEELLIISLILTVAGGDDSGELLLFLILLLLHG